MNYLAHAYLSFNKPEILVGNMISDHVKGKKKFTYVPGIQKGMELHRAIDRFTDDHSATAAAKLFFRPAYRLYSGAFVDVVYDHFLATDSTIFTTADELQNFSITAYNTLTNHFCQLPEAFQKILPYMESQDWLGNYRHTSGIEKAFWGLVKRAVYLEEARTAFFIFTTHYQELRSLYTGFFSDVKHFAAGELSNLLRNDSVYTNK